MSDPDPHRFDDYYPGLRTILGGFEEMLAEKGQNLENMGYREADAAYVAAMELDWFKNYGEGYCRRLEDIQERLGERVERDPHEYPADR